QLQIHIGGAFSMSLTQATLTYQVAAIVAHIPTFNSSATASGSQPSGGILADYQTFGKVFAIDVRQQETQNSGKPYTGPTPTVPVNHVWLRTSDDVSALTSVRAVLASPSSKLALANLYDRRQIATELQN